MNSDDLGALVAVGSSLVQSAMKLIGDAVNASAEQHAEIMARFTSAAEILLGAKAETHTEIADRDAATDAELAALK